MRSLVVDLTIEGEPVSKGRPRKGKGGRVYTPAATRAAEHRLAWLVRLTGVKPVAGVGFAIQAWFLVGDRRRRDHDNMLKLVMDACNGVVWDDDSQVYADACEIVRGVPRPATRICIWQGRDQVLSKAEVFAVSRDWPGRLP